jgi:hypothetical protein
MNIQGSDSTPIKKRQRRPRTQKEQKKRAKIQLKSQLRHLKKPNTKQEKMVCALGDCV